MRIAFVGGFGFERKGTIQARAYPLATELVTRGHEATTPCDNLAESAREWVREGITTDSLRPNDLPRRPVQFGVVVIHREVFPIKAVAI